MSSDTNQLKGFCKCADCGKYINEEDIAYTFNDGYEAVCRKCERET